MARSKLCQWLSAMLVSTCLRAANAAVGEGADTGFAETIPPSSETFPLKTPPTVPAPGRDGTSPILPDS